MKENLKKKGSVLLYLITLIAFYFYPDEIRSLFSKIVYWNIPVTLLLFLPMSFFKRFRGFSADCFVLSCRIFFFHFFFLVASMMPEVAVSPIASIFIFFKSMTWEIFLELASEVVFMLSTAIYSSFLKNKAKTEKEVILKKVA